MTSRALLDAEFVVSHAAGATRYRVARRHRDVGYFECIAIAAVRGTHHFLGSIQVFGRVAIEGHMADDLRDAKDRAEDARVHAIGCLCGTCGAQMVADSVDSRIGVL